MQPSQKTRQLPDLKSVPAKVGTGTASVGFAKGQVVFSQGDLADSIFQIQKGKLKLTVVSSQGREAVIALLTAGDFFGEGCLAGQANRKCTATTMTECVALRLEKPEMARALHTDPVFADTFLKYLLSRNIRIQEDLVDQLFNSSEKRLARVLLLLADFAEADQIRRTDPQIAKISQEMLAEIIGTTRARVNFFMNKFRKLGFIEYDGGGLRVHSSLFQVVSND